MEYGSLPDPPWVLIPGQEIDFLVSYVPNDVGYDESLITITSDDPQNNQLTVVQHGDGDVEQWYSEQWKQDEIPVLDVLWVIDNSGSMMPHQTNLSANIGSFMATFVTSGADYRMAVISTDDSTFSTIVDTTHPDPELAMSSLVIMGTYGSGNEKGIQMAYDSLNNVAAAAPGGNFFRDTAKLIVIFVSDEADHSIPGWNSYISFFDTIKPAGDFIPYGVIGDYPAGCEYNHNGYMRSVQAGMGYWDLIDYYGGNWYSICATDWGVQLQDLAGEVTARKVFDLTEPDPIETTIQVYVNGQLTSAWAYDEELNAVVFNNDSVPDEGQTIIIDYAVWGCGDN
jgi:hypothetical protein